MAARDIIGQKQELLDFIIVIALSVFIYSYYYDIIRHKTCERQFPLIFTRHSGVLEGGSVGPSSVHKEVCICLVTFSHTHTPRTQAGHIWAQSESDWCIIRHFLSLPSQNILKSDLKKS